MSRMCERGGGGGFPSEFAGEIFIKRNVTGLGESAVSLDLSCGFATSRERRVL